MRALDVLRALLGFGDRRVRSKLGLADRRRPRAEVERDAHAELERLAQIRFKGGRGNVQQAQQETLTQQEPVVEKVPAARADQIKPTSDWIFVEEDPAPRETASGLALPDRCNVMEPAFGRVVAAGPGRELPSGAFVAMDLAAGARVVFMRKVHRDRVYPFQVFGDSKDYWFIRRGCSELLAVEEA